MRLRWSILRSAASHKCMLIKRYCVCVCVGCGCLSEGTLCLARLCTTVQFERSFVYCAITDTVTLCECVQTEIVWILGRRRSWNIPEQSGDFGEDLKLTCNWGRSALVRCIYRPGKIPWNSTTKALSSSSNCSNWKSRDGWVPLSSVKTGARRCRVHVSREWQTGEN